MKEWITSRLQSTDHHPQDGIVYWQEKIYNSIIFILSIVVIPGYILGVYLSIANKVYIIAVIDTIVYAALLYMWIFRPFKLKTKILILISLPLIVGCALIIVLGPMGAGLTYFIGFIILTSIFLGIRGVIYGLVIHLVYSSFIALGIYFNWFGNLLVNEYTMINWITVATNSLAICSITSIPLSILLKGLNNYIMQHKTLELSLKDKITQLAKAKDEADRANKLKTKFLANMSHEVRTPLNVILGFSEIVQEGMYQSKSERDSYLITIKKNGQYLLNIIENILQISMIESKQIKYNIIDVDLSAFMYELEVMYQNNNSSLSINFLPTQTAKDIVFKTDQTRLLQVLINLINNAIKYTDDGDVTIRYEMIGNHSLQFIISDTGIGIHPDNMDSIFERFVKIEQPETVKDGMGLGLSISKSMIEALGGTINVESTINKGSVFTVTLPIFNTQTLSPLNTTS